MPEEKTIPKFLRLTVDVKLGDRKQHTSRLNQAADAAIAAAVAKLENELLEDSISGIEQHVEFSYRWIARTSTGADEEAEL